MSIYDHRIVAQIYDKIYNDNEDIDLISDIIGNHRWNILEPMCGTGRIIKELAQQGHTVSGIEKSMEMTEEARKNLAQTGTNWKIENKSALNGNWGTDYDLVILGYDALIELQTAKEQELMIDYAKSALKEMGRIFIDTLVFKEAEMIPYLCLSFEGENDYGTKAICRVGNQKNLKNQQVKISQKLISKTIDGKREDIIYQRVSHIPSARQIRNWLIDRNFQIIHTYGDYEGRNFDDEHERVIFWAQKTVSDRDE